MKHLKTLFALGAMTVGIQAHAAIFGLANPYNLFVSGNANLKYSDVEGKVAIGGNATIEGYSVAYKDQGGDALIVGGNLDFKYGSAYGNVITGGTSTLTGVGLQAGGTAQTGTPLDFGAASTYLKNLSTDLKNLPSNGIVYESYSTLQLIGTDSELNVFTLNPGQVNEFTSVDILVPSGSTVIINVLGGGVNLPNIGYNYNGSQAQGLFSKVLWNLPEATLLTTSSLNGSLLAPFSAATISYSGLNGQLFVDSLVSTGQTNFYMFDGNIPNGGGNNPVPEPATLAAVGIGALGFLSRGRRKARAAKK